jgi:hypothetical protein
MFDFSQLTRRQRIILRNRTERLSELLDWNTLGIYYYRARQMVLQRTHPEFEEELSKLTNESLSSPSTPGVSRSSTPAPAASRSSTPAPPERDEGSEEEDEQEPHPVEKIRVEEKISIPTPALVNETYEPHLERADSVRLLKIKKDIFKDDDDDDEDATKAASVQKPVTKPTYTDDNDAEVSEITDRQQSQSKPYASTSNIKPRLLSDAQSTAFKEKLNLASPDYGILSESHGGQKKVPGEEKKSLVSTQKDLPSADASPKPSSGPDTASFQPPGVIGAQCLSAFIDQQAAKASGKEKK